MMHNLDLIVFLTLLVNLHCKQILHKEKLHYKVKQEVINAFVKPHIRSQNLQRKYNGAVKPLKRVYEETADTLSKKRKLDEQNAKLEEMQQNKTENELKKLHDMKSSIHDIITSISGNRNQKDLLAKLNNEEIAANKKQQQLSKEWKVVPEEVKLQLESDAARRDGTTGIGQTFMAKERSNKYKNKEGNKTFTKENSRIFENNMKEVRKLAADKTRNKNASISDHEKNTLNFISEDGDEMESAEKKHKAGKEHNTTAQKRNKNMVMYEVSQKKQVLSSPPQSVFSAGYEKHNSIKNIPYKEVDIDRDRLKEIRNYFESTRKNLKYRSFIPRARGYKLSKRERMTKRKHVYLNYKGLNARQEIPQTDMYHWHNLTPEDKNIDINLVVPKISQQQTPETREVQNPPLSPAAMLQTLQNMQANANSQNNSPSVVHVPVPASGANGDGMVGHMVSDLTRALDRQQMSSEMQAMTNTLAQTMLNTLILTGHHGEHEGYHGIYGGGNNNNGGSPSQLNIADIENAMIRMKGGGDANAFKVMAEDAANVFLKELKKQKGQGSSGENEVLQDILQELKHKKATDTTLASPPVVLEQEEPATAPEVVLQAPAAAPPVIEQPEVIASPPIVPAAAPITVPAAAPITVPAAAPITAPAAAPIASPVAAPAAAPVAVPAAAPIAAPPAVPPVVPAAQPAAPAVPAAPLPAPAPPLSQQQQSLTQAPRRRKRRRHRKRRRSTPSPTNTAATISGDQLNTSPSPSSPDTSQDTQYQSTTETQGNSYASPDTTTEVNNFTSLSNNENLLKKRKINGQRNILQRILAKAMDKAAKRLSIQSKKQTRRRNHIKSKQNKTLLGFHE